jgi:hypothetical protein
VKCALVVGCSANVWEEVLAAQSMVFFDAVYCVKMAGVHWPGAFKVWATLHPEWMDDYEAQRRGLGLPNGYEIVAPLPGEVGVHSNKGNIARRVSYRWNGMNASASSGIYAAKVALDDGYERVVLAGVPMQGDAGHFTRGRPWLQVDSFLPGLELATPHLKDKVRSMSGRTMEILGLPDRDWLNGVTP